MNDPSNPSWDEIKTWAYSDDDWPDQNWELYLSWVGEIKLFIELATDHKCPNQAFFRHMLYYKVGKAFTGNFGEDRAYIITGYLEHAHGINHGEIRKWVIHTNELLDNPDSYDYEKWHSGILANYGVD